MAPPDNGFNPLRWNCDIKGCFNLWRRPKIELFAECLPGKIAMTDVDATVEINRHFLFIEFKSEANIPTGQRIYYERLTELSEKIAVLVVTAEAKDMTCHEVCNFHCGVRSEWRSCDLDGLKQEICQWAEWAKDGRRG